MKAFISISLLNFGSGSGRTARQIKAELYGDDGSYRASDEGRYQGTYNDYRGVVAVRPVESIRPVRPVIVAQQPTYVQPINPVRVQPAYVQPINPVRVQPAYVQNVAAPIQQAGSGRYAEAYATILRDEKDVGINGYRYLYETSNGIAAEESGNIASEVSGTEARGSFEFVGDNGVKYRVEYTAGADGFRPVGAHLPV
ncbi:Flexible cuticle protein 12 [Eumeta japonica]|uniref:Flexible cuticle protein 12 n=1 Tax=Eumeta variegata TaxID=151549 RepID=A0A4C1YF02_EUMVA|nr:Flexible cuticle protein 12 [Eumeta japonica]